MRNDVQFVDEEGSQRYGQPVVYDTHVNDTDDHKILLIAEAISKEL